MNMEQAKYNMIEQQIRPWSVLDPRILETIEAVPRDDFVPAQYRHLAFADMNIPIGDGQAMLPPKVEARMLQALEPKPYDIVLEIGTGTGFTAALLAHRTQYVKTVEIREEFVATATENLERNEFLNVESVCGDGSQGWESDMEYDCISISGSFIELPDSYRELLAVGGRLAVILGQDPVMEAVLIERTGARAWKTTSLFETHVALLDNAWQPNPFVF